MKTHTSETGIICSVGRPYKARWQYHCFIDKYTWTSHSRKHRPEQMESQLFVTPDRDQRDQQRERTLGWAFLQEIWAGLEQTAAGTPPDRVSAAGAAPGYTGYSSFPRLGRKKHFCQGLARRVVGSTWLPMQNHLPAFARERRKQAGKNMGFFVHV